MPSTVVGTWTSSTPRSHVAATNPARSVDRSPAEPDDGVGAGEVGLAHDLPAERGHLDALALLGIGDLGEQHLDASATSARAAASACAASVGGWTMSTLRARRRQRGADAGQDAAARR